MQATRTITFSVCPSLCLSVCLCLCVSLSLPPSLTLSLFCLFVLPSTPLWGIYSEISIHSLQYTFHSLTRSFTSFQFYITLLIRHRRRTPVYSYPTTEAEHKPNLDISLLLTVCVWVCVCVCVCVPQCISKSCPISVYIYIDPVPCLR